MKPVPILLGGAGVTAAILFGAFQYQSRKVTLPVYDGPVQFFTEGQQHIQLASLPNGVGKLSAEACASCHQKEYAQWKASAHSRSTTEPVFAAAFKTEPRFLCRSCHSPLLEQQPKLVHQADPNMKTLISGRSMPFDHASAMQAFPGGLPHLTENNPHFDKQLSTEGVTCVTCHVREGTILTANPKAKANVPHPLSYAPLMAKADYCAGCHQFDINNPSSHPFEAKPAVNRFARGLQMQKAVMAVNTVQASAQAMVMAQVVQQAAPPAAPAGDDTVPVQPKPSGQTPPVDPDEPPVPPSPGMEGQYHEEARVQHTLDEFRISPAALRGETCQSCHMPKKDGNGAHTWPGRNDVTMLQKAITMTTRMDKPAYKPGEKLQAVIHVKNDAGHRFPTGDSLHAGLLDVWLCDGKKTLGRQVFLMSSQGQSPVNAFINNQVVLDFEGSSRFFAVNGKRVEPATLEAPHRTDTRLLPGEDALFVFRQKVNPEMARAKNLTLRVRVFHSAVHPGFKQSGIDPKLDPMKLVREETLPVTIQAPDAKPEGAPRAETAMRVERRAPRG